LLGRKSNNKKLETYIDPEDIINLSNGDGFFSPGVSIRSIFAPTKLNAKTAEKKIQIIHEVPA
jgi:hypothetical protein